MSSPSRRAFLGCAAAASLARGASPARRPNIVFLLSDDHHFQCLGAAGNPNIQTPHLDHLAARGVRFTNGIVSTAQCAPNRGILLSGLETYQSGLLSNGQTAFRQGAPPTVIQQMRDRAGYETALIGKWHISPAPAACGFAKAPLWMQPGANQYRNPPHMRRGLDGKEETLAGHITDLWTDAAIGYLESAPRQQPFLLWLAYNAPHTPWYAAPKYVEPYRRPLPPPAHPTTGSAYFDWQTYYAVITHLDEAVGRLIAALEKQGLWDNTLIVFLGDNGFLCGTKGLNGKVHPWEESIRVPYFVSGGAVKRPGRTSDALVASIDLPATFCDYAGVKPAAPLSGRSLRGILDGGSGADRDTAFAVWADGRPEALAINRAVEPYRLVRTRTHKYILWESRKDALFDLREDPHEEHPLHDDAIRTRLRRRLEARMKRTADPAIAWLRG